MDEYTLHLGFEARAKFHTTTQQLVSVLQTIAQDGDAEDHAFAQPVLVEQAHYLVLADRFMAIVDTGTIARAGAYHDAVVDPFFDHIDQQIAAQAEEEHQRATQNLADLETTQRIIIASTALVFAVGLFLLVVFGKVVVGTSSTRRHRRNVRGSWSKARLPTHLRACPIIAR